MAVGFIVEEEAGKGCQGRTDMWFQGRWRGAVKITFTASKNLHDWLQPKMSL